MDFETVIDVLPCDVPRSRERHAELFNKKSKEENVTLQAEFIPTDRNRMMYITYKFAGFKEIEGNGEVVVFSGADIDKVEIPDYINLVENM